MRSKHVLIGLVGIVVGVLLASVAVVLAGNLDSPAGPTDPAAQMYAREQIYNRLNDGTTATLLPETVPEAIADVPGVTAEWWAAVQEEIRQDVARAAASSSASANWTDTGENAGDRFGYSVGTAGDVNGDGYADLVVGAYGYDSFRGKAYVYHGSASGLSALANWTATGENTGDTFGWSVGTAGDVNGDGKADLVVGAYGYDGNRGKAYVYHGSASGLSTSANWTDIGENTGDRFGSSVGTAGDVNGSGKADLVVGAYGYDGNRGKAYVYHGSPLDSPGAPDSEVAQMVTLEQIYDRLNDGTAATKMTEFTEPAGGPSVLGTAGTMHSLDEIMDLLKSTYTRVPKTGQTGCWNSSGVSISCTGTGQDGEYQLGVSPEHEPTAGTTGAYTVYGWAGTRFTDNGDGTVSDNLTGLIWLKNANCAGTYNKNWATALSYSNALYDGCTSCFGTSGDCGLSDGSSVGDWRLPNVNELHSLVDLRWNDPPVPNTAGTGRWSEGDPFTGVQSYRYLTSTTFADYTFYAWHVYLFYGHVYPNDKAGTDYVWPVRGGQ